MYVTRKRSFVVTMMRRFRSFVGLVDGSLLSNITQTSLLDKSLIEHVVMGPSNESESDGKSLHTAKALGVVLVLHQSFTDATTTTTVALY